MNYLSVCSGIESASVAWSPLGWKAVGMAEIEPFPAALLHHHYGCGRPLLMPDKFIKANARLPEKNMGIPNYGDITRFREWTGVRPFRLMVGGTPCQSFSVAGLRKGLADPRGNLMLTYLAIAAEYRPEWLVWENVPGVLSSDAGHAFGTFIKGLEELGYHAAWRVLDAQYVRVDGYGRAVPQRRRRVFVVGYLGDWRRAAAVLFDGQSLRWDHPPRREAREGIASEFEDGSGDGVQKGYGGNRTDGPINVATARNGHAGPHGRLDFESETFVVGEVAQTLTQGVDSQGKGGYAGRRREDDTNLVAVALRSEWHDASEDGTGRANLVAFQSKASASNSMNPSDISPTLDKGKSDGMALSSNMTVRRLMPVECEALQGFPRGYTDIPYRGRNTTPDGPRYRAIGNSKAVNVVRWIGRRIEWVNSH